MEKVMRPAAVCIKCGRTLEKTGAGRPLQYCGTACRRAAEFEIRRTAAAIERLEGEAMHVRLHGRSSCFWLSPGVREAEILRLEERLRELMTAGADEAPAIDDEGGDSHDKL